MGDIEPSALTIRVADSLSGVDPAAWDACAGDGNPFVSYAFLSALEDSGSATQHTGWAAQHVLLEDAGGSLLGVVPMYLKNHSQGEYVFDYGWAHAFERAGGEYYPKLQISVPFTPATGPRLLVRGDQPRQKVGEYLLAGCMEVARRYEVSSLHITFPTESEWNLMGEMGMLQRTGEQFHWVNRDYPDFNGFLTDLASRKRKAIRKERREALAPGIEIDVLTGSDIREAHWDAFFQFYMDTGSRKWGTPYLTRDCFSLLSERMADRVVLFMARRDGRYIAGALNFIGSDTIFGRYWGAREPIRDLHFNVCYYAPIEWAIEEGIRVFDPGMGSEHKVRRGFRSVTAYSLHRFFDPKMEAIFAANIERINTWEQATIRALDQAVPYKA
ncbi:MAG: GNAT family N-acetyltransferase [Minwuiales bacterium]|nr:GNAT family N-acetyltransferase [Minwuiales bacterium]